MEKLCIDARGFSVEKKMRVQDAFFKLGIKWAGGCAHQHLDYADQYGNVYSDGNAIDKLMWGHGDMTEQQREYAITYPELMRKAGMDESDTDECPYLQPGDYTTREEIKAYAEREGIELKEAYQHICNAFVAAGADEGDGVQFWDCPLDSLGWHGKHGVLYYTEHPEFTRHLTPDQILSASKQEDLQSEKQPGEVAPKQIGELTVRVGLSTDLQETIRSYLWMLDSVKDEDARNIIKEQLADLTNIQFKEYNND